MGETLYRIVCEGMGEALPIGEELQIVWDDDELILVKPWS